MTTLETYGQGTYGSEVYGDALGIEGTWGNALDGTWGGGHWGGEPFLVPTFIVEVEQEPGVWVDVTCDVRAIDVHRGRSNMLDAFAAATLTLTLADESDRYNAWNASGVWAAGGAFRTDVPLRVSVGFDFDTHRLFTGTTDDVIDSWPGAGADAMTEVRATDALKRITRARPPTIAASFAGDLPGARINRVLDAIAYEGPRNIEPGDLSMAATTMDDTAINLVDEAREVEWGAFYADREGTVRFRARTSAVTDPRQANVQWTFDDQDREGPCYSDLRLIASDAAVFNVATITRPGGAPQQAVDAASRDWFGPRTYTRDDLPANTDVGALTLAQVIVAQHAQNERRIEAIVLDAANHPELWPVALDVRMLDRVRVIRRTGVVIDAELQVQSIHHAVTGGGTGRPATWLVTLGTSNARIVRDAGQWDLGRWDEAKWSV